MLPFVLIRILKPTVLRVFEISNLELGYCFSAYGFTALVSYFFGGILADRFQANRLMAVALMLTGLSGLLLLSKPDLSTLIVIYGTWGVTSIMLFWAAMIKATRSLADSNTQGRTFGFLESGRGLTAAIIATAVVGAFASSSKTYTWPEYRNILLVTSILTLIAGVIVLFVLKGLKTEQQSRVKLGAVLDMTQNSKIWLIATVIICGYVGYKITENFGLYANVVLGFSEKDSSYISTFAFWLRPAAAVLFGFIADKYLTSSVVKWLFVALICGAGLLAIGALESLVVPALIVVLSTAMMLYAIRAIYFAMIHEAKIPMAQTGVAVGLISILGYTPDIFIGPLTGYMLDNNPGATGHQMVFGTMAGFAIVGLLGTIGFQRVNQEQIDKE